VQGCNKSLHNQEVTLKELSRRLLMRKYSCDLVGSGNYRSVYQHMARKYI
jgi:hypothetical protein